MAVILHALVAVVLLAVVLVMIHTLTCHHSGGGFTHSSRSGGEFAYSSRDSYTHSLSRILAEEMAGSLRVMHDFRPLGRIHIEC